VKGAALRADVHGCRRIGTGRRGGEKSCLDSFKIIFGTQQRGNVSPR